MQCSGHKKKMKPNQFKSSSENITLDIKLYVNVFIISLECEITKPVSSKSDNVLYFLWPEITV